MKIGLMSDTHGNSKAIKTAIEKLLAAGAEKIVHLGDSVFDVADFERIFKIEIEKIPGNNEPANSLPNEKIFKWGDLKILALHGHTVALQSYLEEDVYREKLLDLAKKAAAAQADVAIFGHTHRPLDLEIYGVRLLNPGSMELGADRKTCMLLDIEGAKLRAEVIEID